jgi:hypothetical protein
MRSKLTLNLRALDEAPERPAGLAAAAARAASACDIRERAAPAKQGLY